jgi:chloramphenicol 3-O phosphotransferase
MTAGRVIVLDGTSSSGKTTLAKGLQTRLIADGTPWVVTGVDDFFAKLPRAWLKIGNHHGAHADDGVIFDTSSGSFVMHMGSVGDTMLRAYRDAVGAMARAGLSVIVDDVVLRDVEAEMWTSSLAGLDAARVQVRIDLDVLEQREEARADRVLGMARWQYEKVHRFIDYDVTVDTGLLGPDAAANAVYDAVRMFFSTTRSSDSVL